MKQTKWLQKQQERWRNAFAGSVVFHLFVIAALLLWASLGPSIFDLNKSTVKTRLVRKGKARDQSLLPRKEEPLLPSVAEKIPEKSEPVPAAPQEAPTLEDAVKAKTGPSATDKTRSKQSPKVDPLDVLKKHAQAWSNEGNPDSNFERGEVSGELSDSYEAYVQSLIQSVFSLPATLSEYEKKSLDVTVTIRIDDTGKLVDVHVVSPSTNGVYDNAILLATKRVPSFGPPPVTLRSAYKTRGMDVRFCPIQCID